MKLKNKSVLVTGGAGFIGSHLVDRILNENPSNVVVVDNLYLGNKKNLATAMPKIKFYEESAESEEIMGQIMADEGVEVVFNLAVTPLPASLKYPKFAFNENVNITMSMCELLRRDFYRTLIHFSSSEVYGTAEYAPMDEKHPLNGITPYAASKSASDHLVWSYYRTFGSDIAIIRPFNTYGPRQNTEDYAGVIPITMKRIIRGQTLIIEGGGQQTRDFSYVEDVAAAAVKIYESENTRGKVINIASGREVSIETIIRLLNTDGLSVRYLPKRAGDVDRHLADIGLAKTLIDYSPTISHEHGLAETISWYKKEIKC